MSQTEKLLIPLIDENITKDDIENIKFLGVYTEDINSPGIDYVYLVFIYDINNIHMNLGINGIDYTRRIGDCLYHIFKYPKSTDLKRLLNGEYQLISNEAISKIHNFWKNTDEITANYPFARVITKEKYNKTIPEEKYIPLRKSKKPQEFTVPKR